MNFNFLDTLEPSDDKKVDQWEKEQREIEIKNNLSIFMPYGAENQTFDTFHVTNEKESELLECGKRFAESIVNHEFRSLLLLGNVGIGKTHLAYSVMRYVMENGMNKKTNTYTSNGFTGTEVFEYPMIAKYFLIPHLVESYTAAQSFDSKVKQVDIIKNASSGNLIVLDELGFGLRYESEILYQIINNCWIKKIPLILISNMNEPEFCKLLGNASVDRLKDSVISFNTSGMKSHRGGF